jgi:hypothetical protein
MVFGDRRRKIADALRARSHGSGAADATPSCKLNGFPSDEAHDNSFKCKIFRHRVVTRSADLICGGMNEPLAKERRIQTFFNQAVGSKLLPQESSTHDCSK